MIIVRFIANALALAAAALVVPGITLAASTWQRQMLIVAVVALIFGALNALVKPILQLLTGCLIVLTFGLFLWVINAAMLMLTSTVAGWLDVGFRVSGWGSAFLGALIVTLVSSLVGGILRPDRREDER